MKFKALLNYVCVLVISSPLYFCNAAVNADMKVDWRGLVEIPGVLRENSDHHWGALNLIAFGPGWGYSAQDYALKEIQKGGNSLSGNLQVPGTKAVLRETWQLNTTRPDGSQAGKFTWHLRHPEGKSLNMEQAFIKMALGVKDFAGAAVTTDKGASLKLPAEAGDHNIMSAWGCKELKIEGVNAKGKRIVFRVTGENLGFELVDARKENNGNGPTAYWVKLHIQGVKEKSESSVTAWVSAVYPDEEPPPPPPVYTTGANDDWIEFPFTPKVTEGTILDFSFMNRNNGPAGKYGRVLADSNGNYVFEKTGKRVKFSGANLCYTANLMEHEESEELVRDFLKMGYNAVRFHHTDVTTMKGGWHDFWNKTTRGEIDPVQMDKLDYLFAAMKKAGMYITIDLYAMGAMGSMAGREKVFGEIKALVPINDEAFEVWKTSALEWMNHVNPYTGLAWKDDPALVAICPLNEDSIASCWQNARDEYDAAFAEWKKGRENSGRTEKQLRAEFLVEVKVASNKKIKEFFLKNGIHALMTGSNWWTTMPQTFERDSLDVVDNHQYADHPQPGFHVLPCRINHKTTIKEGNPTYMVPVMMAATRIWGKPFVCTEWNFCFPNRHRAEAGLMMGAIAGMQDWDAMYRFSWAHDANEVRKVPHPISGFNIVTDPVGLLSERLFVLLFGRGDMEPALKKYAYGVSMKEATEQGPGNMWSEGLFPHNFNALALESQIGSVVMDKGRPVTGKFNAVVAGEKPADESLLGGNVFTTKAELKSYQSRDKQYVADNGKFRLDGKTGTAAVDTDLTDAIVRQAGDDAVVAGALSVSKVTTFASISASSMDNKRLEDSKRILIMHITDVNNTGMIFSDKGHSNMEKQGNLPYLVKKGSANIKLQNSNPGLRVYALNSDGTRRNNAVPSEYSDGAYSFRVALEGTVPTMLYELAE
ncbi:MAG: hypothetical protein GX804_05770 [Lentisphaerae bacterium]|jgi:hypothetical protein|nr:hypothetical protein [Lentisphaerota bacterium]